MCLRCDVTFGKWHNANGKIDFKTGDCPVCLEKKVECVLQPRCEHYICIKCFRCIYYSKRISKKMNGNEKQEEREMMVDERIADPEYIPEENEEFQQCPVCGL